MLEQAIISGIAHDTCEAKVTILGVPDQPGVAGRVFRPLADAGINIDMIVQNVSASGHTDISFTVPTSELGRAEPILASLCRVGRRRRGSAPTPRSPRSRSSAPA